MAAPTDLVIDQFATFRTSFRWQTKTTGQPVDLTGYEAAMQIRRTPDSDDYIVSLTSAENGGLAIDGEEGRVHIEIDAETTGEFVPGKYVFDLVLIDPLSKRKRLVEGSVRVDAGVTR